MSQPGWPAPDPSVTSAVLALYDALSTTDDDWLAELIADDASVVVIGTDPQEWWDGFDAVKELWSRTRARYGPNTLRARRLAGHSLGGLAWATDEPSFGYPGGQTGRLRLSMVFARGDAGWLLLHLHASIGVPNGDVFA